MTSAPLRILHLGAGRYRPDDREHSTFDIWRELSKEAERYDVLARSTEPKWSTLADGNLTVHLAPSRTVRELEFLFLQFHALRIAREIEPDVVVSQCPVFGGLAALQIAGRHGAATLLELHMSGYVEPAPVAGPWRLRQALSRPALRRATRIRVLSAGMRDRLLEFYGSQLADKVVVLPPRVDLDRFSSRRSEWRINGRAKVAIVGSVTARKRQMEYLEVVLDSPLDLETWIIGDGPQLAACEAFVAERHASDRVRFFGMQSHAQIASLLPQADIMVLYSCMEGTPRALMEGMAAGLPVVTTNAGFCADVVADGVEGFVIDRHRPDQLLERLSRLVADEALRTRMGRAARRRAEQEFDAQKVFSRYRELLAETATAR